MSLAHTTTEGIRTEWVFEVNNLCQRVVGQVGDGDPQYVDTLVSDLLDNLTPAVGVAEVLYLRLSLALMVSHLGRALHDQFHAVFSPSPCAAAPPLGSQHVWIDQQRSIPQLALGWAAEYAAWFHEHHVITPALLAKRVLDETFVSPPTVHALARKVGCSKTTLIDQFSRSLGLSPAAYVTRVRLTTALRRLRSSTENVEHIAREVGYASENTFTALIRRHTGLTPPRVRRLNDVEFDRLLERVIDSSGRSRRVIGQRSAAVRRVRAHRTIHRSVAADRDRRKASGR